MSYWGLKRPALLIALCFAVICVFVLRRSSVVFPSGSNPPAAARSKAEANASARGLAQQFLRHEGWNGFRRLADGMSPPAPAGHLYFSDDETPPMMEPSPEEHGHGHAWRHKPLHPIDGWDIAGVGLACIGLMIAAAGGIGGGGILVPLYILVMGFDPKHAIPLSNITIFGGAITNTVLNLSKRHPNADRPLVDWDVILVMEPLTIGGALVGSFINKVKRMSRTGRRQQEIMLVY